MADSLYSTFPGSQEDQPLDPNRSLLVDPDPSSINRIKLAGRSSYLKWNESQILQGKEGTDGALNEKKWAGEWQEQFQNKVTAKLQEFDGVKSVLIFTALGGGSATSVKLDFLAEQNISIFFFCLMPDARSVDYEANKKPQFDQNKQKNRGFGHALEYVNTSAGVHQFCPITQSFTCFTNKQLLNYCKLQRKVASPGFEEANAVIAKIVHTLALTKYDLRANALSDIKTQDHYYKFNSVSLVEASGTADVDCKGLFASSSQLSFFRYPLGHANYIMAENQKAKEAYLAKAGGEMSVSGMIAKFRNIFVYNGNSKATFAGLEKLSQTHELPLFHAEDPPAGTQTLISFDCQHPSTVAYFEDIADKWGGQWTLRAYNYHMIFHYENESQPQLYDESHQKVINEYKILWPETKTKKK